MPSKKHAERMPHVTFGTHKKTMLWSGSTKKQSFGPVPKHPNASRSGSETPERQQETTSRLKLKETTSRLKLKETTSRLLGALPL